MEAGMKRDSVGWRKEARKAEGKWWARSRRPRLIRR